MGAFPFEDGTGASLADAELVIEDAVSVVACDC
jgi:hypothetical protein